MLFSGGVNINCDYGQYGCREADFYCPDQVDCNIICDKSESCYNANFYIPRKEYKGLNLICNSLISDACHLSDIQCLSDGASTRMTYDSTNGVWICQDFDCCPLREGYIDCFNESQCLVCI